jgi:AcrR family transcriptional regulator
MPAQRTAAPRRSQARGDRARHAILETAMAYATVDGLDGLSLGQLAARLGVSKAGLFAHFPSKEALQLAVIEFTVARFQETVVAPALRETSRLRRLWRVHELNLDWIARPDLPGGCFFINAQFEYDVKPGPVRDRLTAAMVEWLDFLERLVASAVRAGELRPEADPRQIAFEINAFDTAVVSLSRLLPDRATYELARTSALHRLRGLATDPNLLPES